MRTWYPPPWPPWATRTPSPTEDSEIWMSTERVCTSCADRHRSSVGVPGTIVTGSAYASSDGGRVIHGRPTPSSSGNHAVLPRRRVPCGRELSGQPLGLRCREVDPFGGVGRQVVQRPLVVAERGERPVVGDDLHPSR